MHRHRVLVAFGIAWLSAVLLSWWVYKRTTAPQSRQVIQVVAAARDLSVGQRITAADVKLLTLDRKDLPMGVHLKILDVVDRAVTIPLASSELVLESKLALKGGGEGMPALIEPGMRAVSVQVNEISGVSGFIQPGTRVDVLFTRVFQNGDAATTTVLQNVKVIAYGKQLQADAKVDPRDKPTVATLVVTADQAQRLALAVQRGRIQLVLRNPLDDQISEQAVPVSSADLGIEDPARKMPVRQAAPPPAPKPQKPRGPSGAVEQRVSSSNDGQIVVHVYRGSKVSENVFESGTAQSQ